MEFLRLFLRRHFAGKPVLGSRNVGCFLRLVFHAADFSSSREIKTPAWETASRDGLCPRHRRTGYFLPGGGGAVNRLPKKFFHVASNFYKTVEQKRGPMQKHRPYWLMKMARYSFSGSIPAKFKHKLRRHKQPFGKTATTVVLCIGQIEASTSPPPPPRHTLGV